MSSRKQSQELLYICLISKSNSEIIEGSWYITQRSIQMVFMQVSEDCLKVSLPTRVLQISAQRAFGAKELSSILLMQCLCCRDYQQYQLWQHQQCQLWQQQYHQHLKYQYPEQQ